MTKKKSFPDSCLNFGERQQKNEKKNDSNDLQSQKYK